MILTDLARMARREALLFALGGAPGVKRRLVRAVHSGSPAPVVVVLQHGTRALRAVALALPRPTLPTLK